MVRAEGLEPPHLSVHEPKPCASTSSATPALIRYLIYVYPKIINIKLGRVTGIEPAASRVTV